MKNVCTGNGQTSVGYSKFCDLWNQLCPFFVIMRPATDLCWTCQKNNKLIQKSVNMPESQKAEAIRAQEQHLQLAAGEREFYKNCCRQSKENIHQYLQEIDFNFGRAPCSYNGTVHYSYDYAQRLHYTSDPNQPGLSPAMTGQHSSDCTLRNFLRSNLTTIFAFTKTIQALYSAKSTGTQKRKP